MSVPGAQTIFQVLYIAGELIANSTERGRSEVGRPIIVIASNEEAEGRPWLSSLAGALWMKSPGTASALPATASHSRGVPAELGVCSLRGK